MLGARSRSALALVAALATSTAAKAQDDTCREGFEQADLLLKPGSGDPKLIEAREKLRACAHPSCKEWMIADCTKRIGEVESRISTVVFAARDAFGKELVDVTILTGDTTIATKLDGRAVEMNPGALVFVFVLPDGSRREVKAIVHEGQKAERVAYEAPREMETTAPRPTETPVPVPPTTRTNPLVYVGFGTFVAGVAVGTVTGIFALSRASTNECDGTRCTSAGLQDIDQGRSFALVSTIAFPVGLVGLGVGIYGLLAPARSSRAGRIVPWVNAQQAGIRGTF